MDGTERLTRFALLCGQCSCGCPELFVDHDAPPERKIVITDDLAAADERGPVRRPPRGGPLQPPRRDRRGADRPLARLRPRSWLENRTWGDGTIPTQAGPPADSSSSGRLDCDPHRANAATVTGRTTRRRQAPRTEHPPRLGTSFSTRRVAVVTREANGNGCSPSFPAGCHRDSIGCVRPLFRRRSYEPGTRII